MEYTASQVATLVEAKLRTIQLWADFEIILPVKGTQGAGTGTHRKFDIVEVRIAALLMPFASIGVPRGVLKRASVHFREALSPRGSRSIGLRRLRAAIDRALAGVGQNFVYYLSAGETFSFETVTDENGPAVINPMVDDPVWKSLMNERTTHLGIINLNAAMRGLV